jgi:tetratricopeptide (TPR) repeat protein
MFFSKKIKMVKKQYLVRLGIVLFLATSCYECKKASEVQIVAKVVDVSIDSLRGFKQGTIENDLFYKIVTEKYPRMSDAWMGRSISYTKRGLYDKGFELVNKAVDLSPSNHLGYRGYIKLYMFHDYNGALRDFQRLDSLTPNFQDAPWSEDIYKVIGLCYLNMDNNEKAEKYFDLSISTNTEQRGVEWVEPRTFIYYGVTLLKNKKINNALSVFNKSIEINPEVPEAYYYKSKILLDKGKLSEARSTINKCLEVFNKYGNHINSYYELPYQLYLSQIKSLKNKIYADS